MSVRLIQAAFQTELESTEKFVLVALADFADDDGRCFPSIATLGKRTGHSRATIFRALAALETAGHIIRNVRPGKGTVYIVHPSHVETGPTVGPVSESDGTRRTVRPLPSHSETQTVIEPSGTVNVEANASTRRPRKPAENAFPKPDWADPQVWADFLTNRKAKRCQNTPTAYKRFLDDISRLASGEWPPGRLLEHAAARGWAGIFEPREMRNEQDNLRGPDRRDSFERACDDLIFGGRSAADRRGESTSDIGLRLAQKSAGRHDA